MLTSPADLAAVRAAIEAHRDREGALLPILHAVQHALGFIPPDAVPVIAQAVNQSRAEVHGVITYYHHFRQSPPGRCAVQVCRAEACRAMGGEALLAHARAVTGCTEDTPTSADGRYTVEAAYCLGLCASSPAALIGPPGHERPVARLTPERLSSLLADAGKLQ